MDDTHFSKGSLSNDLDRLEIIQSESCASEAEEGRLGASKLGELSRAPVIREGGVRCQSLLQLRSSAGDKQVSPARSMPRACS